MLTFEMCFVCEIIMLFYIFINDVKSILIIRFKKLLCEY